MARGLISQPSPAEIAEYGGRGLGGGRPASWTPAALTGLRGWYRADLGITLVGSDVDAWADQSGVGNHLSAAAAGNRPAYSASDANFGGRASLTFDGAGEYLRDAAFSWGAAIDAYTVTIIGGGVTSTNGDILWSYGATSQPRAEQQGTAKWRHRGNGAVVADSATASTVTGVWSFVWTGTTQSTYLGTVSDVGPTANANAAPADGGVFALAASVAGAALVNVRVAEVIIQRAAITADERTALKAYAARYGL